MTVPTVAVTCRASGQNGVSIPGAVFVFKLNQTELYNGFVVPSEVTGTADINGTVVVQLFPNVLGAVGSLYKVNAIEPVTGRRFLKASASVPNAACDLMNILTDLPPAAIDGASQAVIDARAARDASGVSAAASGVSAAASEVSRLASGVSATAAAASQLAAAGSATAASGSAASALASLNEFKGRSYGLLAADPMLDPLGAALTVGDEYFNTVALVTKRYNGTVWVADVSRTDLAASGGAALVGGTWFGGVVATVAALASSLGASLIGWIQTGTGVVIRAIQNKLRERVSVFDFMTEAEIAGCVAGTVDVSTACINAMKACCTGYAQKPRTLFWPQGVYLITQPFLCGSDVYMDFDPGTVINFTPATNNETTSLFVASNQVNVSFRGNGATLNGARAGAAPAVEGSAAAFYFYGTDNYSVQDFNINNFSTDGLIMTGDNGASGPCTNGFIKNLVVDNCRRNGMSIIHADGLTVIGGKYKNSNGAPAGPFSGIDVEPNASQSTKNISLIDVYTEGNKGGGLLFVPAGGSNVVGSTYSVLVRGGRSFKDGQTTIWPGLRFAGGNCTNVVSGFVSVTDYVVESPNGRGVDWSNWDALTAPQVILTNVKVINADGTGVAVLTEDRSGFVALATAATVVTNVGNFKLINCSAVDTRTTARMNLGFYMAVAGGSAKTLRNIEITNPLSVNYTIAGPDVSVQGATQSNGVSGVTVTYTDGRKLAAGFSISDFGRYVGVVLEATASINITLPLAANCVGSTYRMQTAGGINNVSVIIASGDTVASIAPYGGVIVLNDGAYLEIVSLGGTAWKARAILGKYWLTGSSPPGRLIWAAAAPITGTWDRGDRAFHSAPVVGSPKGFICTVAGTPGTWVSEGVL